jgi:hypothetical protein
MRTRPRFVGKCASAALLPPNAIHTGTSAFGPKPLARRSRRLDAVRHPRLTSRCAAVAAPGSDRKGQIMLLFLYGVLAMALAVRAHRRRTSGVPLYVHA